MSEHAVCADRTTIDFTDGCMVLAIACTVFWGVDPFELDLWRYPVVRHLPMALASMAFLMGLAGRMTFRPQRMNYAGTALGTYAGLILFGIFALIGSLYARFVDDVTSTFYAMGAAVILGGPVNLWIIRTSSAPLAMIRSITFVFFAISALAVVVNGVRFGDLIFHSVENVVLVAVAFPLLASRRLGVRAASVLLIILGAVAPNRLTGYLVVLIVFAWVGVDELATRLARDPDRLRAALRLYIGALAGLLSVVVGIVIFESTRSMLPDGNVVYRQHMYQMVFTRFLDSWFWGRAFAAPAVDFFDLYVVNSTTQYLPTHNDLLDILANGGLLAAVPFACGLVYLIFLGWNALRAAWTFGRPESSESSILRPHLALYFLIVVTGIPVMTFNPVLNQWSLAYMFWTATAVMCALAMPARAGRYRPAGAGPGSDPVRPASAGAR